MKINVASGQIQGKRDYQQDAFGQRDIPFEHKLLFLADGMGGYKGGEKASELVIERFMKQPPSATKIEDFLIEILEQSNRDITLHKKSNPDVSSMGTTLVAMSITGNICQWISVGDSPLYRIRDNSIQRINENHSVAGFLDLQVKNREISQKEANNNPNRHMLTSALTGEELSMVDLSKPIKIKSKDIFILASDGVETLSEDDILRLVLSSKGNMDIAVTRVLNEIERKNKSNQDNATIIIVSLSEDNSVQSTFSPKQEHYGKELSNRKNSKSLPIILIALLIALASLIGIVVGLPNLPVDNNETNISTSDENTTGKKNKTSKGVEKDTNKTGSDENNSHNNDLNYSTQTMSK